MTAIVDSGTSLLVGPEDDVHTIATNMGAVYNYWEGIWTLDSCLDVSTYGRYLHSTFYV